ncbi:hypothetical protein BpHYR1_052247 [Brachionus plicatilis]|uniref:Uncharacterized protein n=1 Tax=Brachionus plicatilis TaxID=10195 RepID=A0A3M7TAP3_BRAPC|nr:hypothetical protein BpHYR1_052247 [Brachionus plicatilis]
MLSEKPKKALIEINRLTKFCLSYFLNNKNLNFWMLYSGDIRKLNFLKNFVCKKDKQLSCECKILKLQSIVVVTQLKI